MAKLIVVTREGKEIVVDAGADRSVMEAIRDAGMDELLALCGGQCSCATCHVYVDDAESFGLPAITDDEDELLNTTQHRSPRSRLSCQLMLSNVPDGLRVTIAPEG